MTATRPRNDTTTSPWKTVADAADYTGRHEQTVRAALRDNTLRGYRPGRRGFWRIHRDDLDAWVRGETSPVTVPTITRRNARAS